MLQTYADCVDHPLPQARHHSVAQAVPGTTNNHHSVAQAVPSGRLNVHQNGKSLMSNQT